MFTTGPLEALERQACKQPQLAAVDRSQCSTPDATADALETATRLQFAREVLGLSVVDLAAETHRVDTDIRMAVASLLNEPSAAPIYPIPRGARVICPSHRVDLANVEEERDGPLSVRPEHDARVREGAKKLPLGPTSHGEKLDTDA